MTLFSSSEPSRHSPVDLARQPVLRQEGNPPPPGAASSGLERFFEAFQLPRLIAMRSGIVIAVLLVVCIGLVVAMVEMARNSGPRPYFLEHDKASGAVWLSNSVSETYTPQKNDITFQLRRWATRFQAISIDAQHTLSEDQPAAYSWTIGAASNEFNAYFDKEDNVAEIVTRTPGTSREVAENGTSYSADGKTAFMIITRTWKVNGSQSNVDTKLLRMNYLIAPETLKPGEERDNPLGVRIADFLVTPYYGPVASK